MDTKFDKKEIETGKGMAILSYIIALIPYFAEKNNKFARFHAVQGMNIFLIAVGWAIVNWIITAIATSIACSGGLYSCLSGAGMVGIVSTILSLVSIAIGVFDIIGLVYAATGQAKEVPLLGKIKIIKK
ncbi:MAG: DUF4870 domain-containing protein [Candidatus Nomurabacteria bacterium]|jgi:uncharacterized membrane protein|nr:DUF4870 domain-containing protein [Candidatus Nomurabacteria bacterium]